MENVAKGIKNKAPRLERFIICVLKHYSCSFFSTLFVTSYMIGVAMKIEA